MHIDRYAQIRMHMYVHTYIHISVYIPSEAIRDFIILLISYMYICMYSSVQIHIHRHLSSCRTRPVQGPRSMLAYKEGPKACAKLLTDLPRFKPESWTVTGLRSQNQTKEIRPSYITPNPYSNFLESTVSPLSIQPWAKPRT